MTRDQCDVPAPEECPLYPGTARAAVTAAQVAAGARGAAQPPQPSLGPFNWLPLTHSRGSVDSLVLRLQSLVLRLPVLC